MRTRSLALLAVTASGGFIAARRALASRVATWDTNPDPTGGDPLTLPAFSDLAVEAADGARLHGHRCGDPSGPTVVLIHGFTNSTRFWAPVARQLAASGLDVVLLDQRGHGGSGRGEAPYSTATIASDVRCWLEALDVRDAVLCGHSMGGVAAMSTAVEHPDVVAARVRSLVLVATLAHPSIPMPIDTALAMRIGVRALRLENLGLFGLAAGVFGTRPARVALEATRAGFLATDPATRVDAADMCGDFDLRPHLPGISIPTTVLAGSHDRLTLLEGNEEIADLIPGAVLEVLPGIGHMIAFEAPDSVIDLVLQSTKPRETAV